MEIRKFKPGELICRMSKRSRLNQTFHHLQEHSHNSIKDELKVAKALKSGGDDDAEATILSGFVKSLKNTKKPKMGKR